MRFLDWSQLTNFVKYLLYANILYSLIGLVVGSSEIQLLEEIRAVQPNISDDLMSRANENDERQAVMGIVGFIVFLLAGVLILTWIRRAG